MLQKVAHINPVLQVFRLEEWLIRAPGNGIISIADTKTVRIESSHFRNGSVTLAVVHGIWLFPVIQLMISGQGNPVLSQVSIGVITIIDNGRSALFGNKTCPTEHAVPGKSRL